MGSCVTINKKILVTPGNLTNISSSTAKPYKIRFPKFNIKELEEISRLREQAMKAKCAKAPILNIASNALFQKRQNNHIVFNSIHLKVNHRSKRDLPQDQTLV